MENNCFVVKLKDSLLGDYDKLNFLKVKVHNGENVTFSPDKSTDVIVKAEGCTFTLDYYLVIDATEHTFKQQTPYDYLTFKINGDGYLYIGNKYNIGRYALYNADLDKIYSYDKGIKYFTVMFANHSYAKGNINHLLSQCSPDLELLVLDNGGALAFDITGDIAEVSKFTKLKKLVLGNQAFFTDIINFSPLINLEYLFLYASRCTGNVEELALTWYNKGKTTGTVEFELAITDIIVPSIITDKSQFYCTFTEEGYTFSLTKSNT